MILATSYLQMQCNLQIEKKPNPTHRWIGCILGDQQPLELKHPLVHCISRNCLQWEHIQPKVVSVIYSIYSTYSNSSWTKQYIFQSKGLCPARKRQNSPCNDSLWNLENRHFLPQVVVLWYVCQLQSKPKQQRAGWMGEWTDRRAHTHVHNFCHARAISPTQFPITNLQTASIFFYLHNQCEQLQRRIYDAA